MAVMKLEDICISYIMRYNIETSPELIPRERHEKLHKIVRVNGDFKPCQPSEIKMIQIIHNSEGLRIRFLGPQDRAQELHISYGSAVDFNFDFLLKIPLSGKATFHIKYLLEKTVISLFSEDEIRKCSLMLEM